MSVDATTLARDLCRLRSAAPVYHLTAYGDGAVSPVETQAPRGLASALAIGAVDGCHLGHRELLERTVAFARERGIAAVAVTFDPDPDEVVSSQPAAKLTAPADRLRALATSGVDAVVVVPFNLALASLGHEQFFCDVLATMLDIRAIHVGCDFRLGARGASTVDIIAAWGAQRGIEVFGHDLVLDGGHAVTATRIRGLIAEGDVSSAAVELGRRYLVRGRVRAGRGQGAGMGFPTANIEVPAGICMPLDGVYAGFAVLDEPEGLEVWAAAVNVGIPPMFADSALSCGLEANLLGFSGDLYGREIAIAFDRRLRASTTFGSLDELIETVHRDIDTTRALLGDVRTVIARD